MTCRGPGTRTNGAAELDAWPPSRGLPDTLGSPRGASLVPGVAALAASCRECGISLAGALLVVVSAGCTPPETLIAERAALDAGRTMSRRAALQRHEADELLMWPDGATWDEFLEALRLRAAGVGMIVVGYPLRSVEPSPRQLDQVASILRDKGYSRVVQHQILTNRIIILRE